MFVLSYRGKCSGINFLINSRRNDVRDWFAVAVFFEVDSRLLEESMIGLVARHIFSWGLYCLSVCAPFASDKIQGGETNDDVALETFHENSHKSDGREAFYVTDNLIWFSDRDAELIPFDFFDLFNGSGF